MSDRPLWNLLLDIKNRESLQKRPLNCSECFIILEYLAETFVRVENGFDLRQLREAAEEHLSTCPDCRAYYLRRLRELEDAFDS